MGLDSLKTTAKSTGTIPESECSRLHLVRRTEVCLGRGQVFKSALWVFRNGGDLL